MINELNSFPNLVILQTLSKAWGLAGLRLGLCISHPELVRILDAIKPPYNISSATQAAAGEILKAGTGKRDAAVAEILAQRKWLRDEFEKLGLRVFPSDANFLLVRFTDPKRIMHALRESGIIVRDRSGEHGCAGCLRITVGTPAENRQLIEKLKQLIQA